MGGNLLLTLSAGIEFDHIDGYRVYHGESADGSDKEYYTYFKQPTTNCGSIVVQENTGDILYYWVRPSTPRVGIGMPRFLLFTSIPTIRLLPRPLQSRPPVTSARLCCSTDGERQHMLDTGRTRTRTTERTLASAPASTVCLFTSPDNAFDGNQTTAASFSDRNHADYAGCVWSFAGFTPLPDGVTVTTATLSVTSEVPAMSRKPIYGR